MSSTPSSSVLSVFHPVIGRWFRERVGTPTDTQCQAWPQIVRGEHVLVTAPTGSGKTLTAFLWALHQLLTGAWSTGRTRVLYVSPLKALNHDIQRNLLAPLAELEVRFREAGEVVPAIQVLTRSGDTTEKQRRRIFRHPPEILITTPESLNILLASRSGREILKGLATVILDEIHAVAGSKRGTHLITAVDRLVLLSGEFQRLALSATLRPLDRVARLVGGYLQEETAGEIRYRPREVRTVRSSDAKSYDLQVDFPAGAVPADGEPLDPLAPPEPLWDFLVRDLRRRIRANRSTLVFANSRRMAEKVTRLLNEGEPRELAYSHHGSLSKEIRSVVEERLKEGRLAAIVATSSLELGIDIGALDEVLLLQTPPTVASAVQRLGRAGHGVGEVSRGRLYPIFGRDFLEAAVVASSVLERDIEEVRPVTGALDVLAQVILGMLSAEDWKVDDLHAFLRTSDPYHTLSRRQLDLVLEMLAGRYADSRVRELAPRISIDRLDGTLRARRGAMLALLFSGGTIPDRGYFHLRLESSLAKIGELDEEFVWERSLGDTFVLGAHSWRIRKITHNDVMVAPAPRGASMAPFWRAEERFRSFHLAERVGRFLEAAENTLSTRGGDDHLRRQLTGDGHLAPAAAEELVKLLRRQKDTTGTSLPHRHHLLVEHVVDDLPRAESAPVLLHTFWGGRVNRPFSVALAAAWEERHEFPLGVDHDNDCLIVALPLGARVDELFDLVRPDNVERLLRSHLERTGFFGARFRENAGRALLLPRSDPRRRVPLWVSRERAKKLLTAVSRYEDFPIVVETWRTCIEDELDLASLKRVLEELARGEIRWSEARTSTPSPLASGMLWKQTNRLMYEDDTPAGGSGPSISESLLQELVSSPELRPRLPAALLQRFESKLQRTFPGYPPQDAWELLDWVRERSALTPGEWQALLQALEGEGALRSEELLAKVGDRLARVRRSGGGEWITSLEALPRWLAALGLSIGDVTLEPVAPGAPPPALEALTAWLAEPIDEDPAELATGLFGEWLRFYGPISPHLPVQVFGVEETEVGLWVESLETSGELVVGHLREGASGEDGVEICDAQNLEHLLRLLRAESRPRLETLPLEELPLFWAHHQGLGRKGAGVEELQEALECLLGYPAPAGLWESDLLPARVDPYYTSWLDSLLQETELGWVGCGKERLTFAFPEEHALLRSPVSEPGGEVSARELERELEETFPEPSARFSLGDLAASRGVPWQSQAERLWELAWSGKVSNTTFLAVRRAAQGQFQVTEEGASFRGEGAAGSPGRRRSGRPARFRRWAPSSPLVGDWFRLEGSSSQEAVESLDALDREELNKDRVRLLLERYGVIFREVLSRELPSFQWSGLFRTLRLLELSGEIVSGHFFAGVPGPQFASTAAVRRLREGLSRDHIFWVGALDPASPCGLGLEELRGALPARLPSNHLVFHGPRQVVVSRRNAGELDIRVEPDHPQLEEYLEFMKVLLTRQFHPLKAIDVEVINGERAPTSPFAPHITRAFSATREPRALRLRRRY